MGHPILRTHLRNKPFFFSFLSLGLTFQVNYSRKSKFLHFVSCSNTLGATEYSYLCVSDGNLSIIDKTLEKQKYWGFTPVIFRCSNHSPQASPEIFSLSPKPFILHQGCCWNHKFPSHKFVGSTLFRRLYISLFFGFIPGSG